MKPKYIIVLVVLVLVLIVLVQNAQVVTLRFLFWKVSMSRIIFLPLTLLAGFVLGFITAKMTGGRSSKNP